MSATPRNRERVADHPAISSALARFVASTTVDELPEAVVERVKKSVLDTLGCGLYGSSLDTAHVPLRYARAHAGQAEATIIGSGDKSSAFTAALTNGTFVHTTELAEGFTRALVHPGNVVVPAVLAAGERDRRSGRDLVAATAVAYEVLIRLGLTCGLHLCLDLGLHPPAMLGSFASAAATARLAGLDESATSDALGIVACHTPTPLLRAADQHASVKDGFQGYAAALGIFTTELAATGVTGLDDWVGPWFTAIPRSYDLDPLLDRLGEFWHVSSGGIRTKTRPVMAMAQPAMQAMYELLGEHTLDHRDIAAVRVESSKRIELGRIYRPSDVVSARASIPFLVASALVHPEAFRSDPYMIDFIAPALLEDEAVHGLSEKVELAVDPAFDHNLERAEVDPDGPAYMKFEARVTLRLHDGTEIIRSADMFAIGTGRMTRTEIADKFLTIATRAIPERRAEEVVSMVWDLDQLDDVGDLAALLSPGS